MVKQIATLTLMIAFTALFLTACNSVKDCRGRTKHRTHNGIWM